MKNKLRDNLGMTLVEVLVGISIITITTGLMLVNYRSYNSKNNLVMGAYRLASDLRLAQNYALGLKEYNGDQPNGWGLYFDTTSSVSEKQYIIYADSPSGDGMYTSGEEVNTIALPEGVIINEFDIISPEAHFFVEPPDPDIKIYDVGGVEQDEIIITLGYTGGADTREVKINKFGLIDIN